jgi:uncharacterized BrkB/YihY/UPF0761 family membrane protein
LVACRCAREHVNVLLALFPAIAALVSLYGLFADPRAIGQHINDLSGFLPGGATHRSSAIN